MINILPDNTNCWGGYGATGMLMHGWWECKLVHHFLPQYVIRQNKAELITSNSTPGTHPPKVHTCETQNSCIKNGQFSSVAQSCYSLQPWNTACQASLSITNSQSPPKPMSIVSVLPSNHLIFCIPLLLLPPIPPSIRVFSNESTLHIRWPKYWSFSFSISPSNEHPGLISFSMDSLDLLAVQETLKSLLQHNSSKASILQHSAFFIVQLSHPYMTTGKIIPLTRQISLAK